MPIGKNAIKRVSTGTSAQVNAQAVEVVVTEPKAEETVVPKAAPKTAPKKAAPKKSAPKKSMEKEPDLSPVKTAEKVVKKKISATEPQGIAHFYLGDELPYYLL